MILSVRSLFGSDCMIATTRSTACCKASQLWPAFSTPKTPLNGVWRIERGKPFDQLLNKLRVAEQFLVAGFKSRPGTDLKSVPTLVLTLLPGDRFINLSPLYLSFLLGTDFKSVPASPFPPSGQISNLSRLYPLSRLTPLYRSPRLQPAADSNSTPGLQHRH